MVRTKEKKIFYPEYLERWDKSKPRNTLVMSKLKKNIKVWA